MKLGGIIFIAVLVLYITPILQRIGVLFRPTACLVNIGVRGCVFVFGCSSQETADHDLYLVSFPGEESDVSPRASASRFDLTRLNCDVFVAW